MIFPNGINDRFSYEDVPYPMDWAYDFEKGALKNASGKNAVAEGAEAVKMLIYKLLRTPKGVYKAYGENFGSDFSAVIGSSDRSETESGIRGAIEEALSRCRYITGIRDIAFRYEDSSVYVTMTVGTVFSKDVMADLFIDL